MRESFSPPVNLTAQDNCAGAITVSPTDSSLPNDNCSQTVIRTWKFTDDGNNSNSISQTITVKDNTAPVPPLPPADVTVQCVANIPPPINLTAQDNCDGAITVSATDSALPTDNCGQRVIRTWTFTDNCGATSSIIQTITIRDNITPIPPLPPADVTVQCVASIPPPVNLTAQDNCDGPITVSPVDSARPADNCSQTVTRTWTFTDNCGATSSINQTITIRDDIAPVLRNVPANVTVECDAVPGPASPTATDNCDTEISITLAEVRTDGACQDVFTLTRTWTATDKCGNASSKTQIIEKDLTSVLGEALESDLVLGFSQTTLTITRDDAACIAQWLPYREGEIQIDRLTLLPRDRNVGVDDCLPGENELDRSRRITNPLFGGGLQLALYIRLNPEFGLTKMTEIDCVTPIVRQVLGMRNNPNVNINDLMDVVNKALGNTISPVQSEGLVKVLNCLNLDLCDNVEE